MIKPQSLSAFVCFHSLLSVFLLNSWQDLDRVYIFLIRDSYQGFLENARFLSRISRVFSLGTLKTSLVVAATVMTFDNSSGRDDYYLGDLTSPNAQGQGTSPNSCNLVITSSSYKYSVLYTSLQFRTTRTRGTLFVIASNQTNHLTSAMLSRGQVVLKQTLYVKFILMNKVAISQCKTLRICKTTFNFLLQV